MSKRLDQAAILFTGAYSHAHVTSRRKPFIGIAISDQNSMVPVIKRVRNSEAVGMSAPQFKKQIVRADGNTTRPSPLNDSAEMLTLDRVFTQGCFRIFAIRNGFGESVDAPVELLARLAAKIRCAGWSPDGRRHIRPAAPDTRRTS